MPRRARIDAPGAFHHIIIRAMERRKIFLDDQDRREFVDRLARYVGSLFEMEPEDVLSPGKYRQWVTYRGSCSPEWPWLTP